MYCVSCTLICTSILIIMLTLSMSHNSHTRYPAPSHSIPVILSCHLYVKHKTIVRNIVHIQFVILPIVITVSCLTTIVYTVLFSVSLKCDVISILSGLYFTTKTNAY